MHHRFLFGVLMFVAAAPAQAVEDDGAILRRQAQELMDAVSVGNAKIWEKYMDPQVVYIDEEGKVTDKGALVAQVTPLPPGISGSIKAEVVELHLFGDTAVLHVDDHESENYFGHALKAEYRSIETWRRSSDGWKLIAGQVYASLIDPPSITLPPARLDEYAGTYRLSASVTYTLHRQGDKLIGQRLGRDPAALSVEVPDVFFVPGQPRSRKVMLRDAQGRITGFADRRDGRDVVWAREK